MARSIFLGGTQTIDEIEREDARDFLDSVHGRHLADAWLQHTGRAIEYHLAGKSVAKQVASWRAKT